MGLDDFLSHTSPVGISWAFLFSYIFIALLIAFIAIMLVKLNKARIVYGIVVVVGIILFLRSILGYDVTGILWDAWTTLKTSLGVGS